MKQKQMTKLKKGKPYREAFVASQISVGIPFQIRALREQRGWGQKQLAETAGMLQPRISAIEKPGNGRLNLETLKRLAAAFDVGLLVKFVPFTELIQWADDFSPDTFHVTSFEDEEAAKPTASANATTPRLYLVVDNSGTPALRDGSVRIPEPMKMAGTQGMPISNEHVMLQYYGV